MARNWEHEQFRHSPQADFTVGHGCGVPTGLGTDGLTMAVR